MRARPSASSARRRVPSTAVAAARSLVRASSSWCCTSLAPRGTYTASSSPISPPCSSDSAGPTIAARCDVSGFACARAEAGTSAAAKRLESEARTSVERRTMAASCRTSDPCEPRGRRRRLPPPATAPGTVPRPASPPPRPRKAFEGWERAPTPPFYNVLPRFSWSGRRRRGIVMGGAAGPPRPRHHRLYEGSPVAPRSESRPVMRSRLAFAAAALLGALLLMPSPARAFSVDDVIQMHLDQFADSLIVLKIRNSGSVFHLEMKDLHKLKEAGVSDDVVAAMLNTEKPGDVPVLTGGTPLQMPPAQAPADSTTPTASTAPVTTPDAAAKPTVTPSETITTGAPYYVPRPHH